MSSPWKRRVMWPETVPLAYPPMPFVTSHSRPSSGLSGSERFGGVSCPPNVI